MDNKDKTSNEVDVAESSVDEQSQNAKDIADIVNDRMSSYSSTVLASQIQKAVPDITNIEKRSSIHVILQNLSEASHLKHPNQKKDVVIKIPKKSLIATHVTLEEYVIPGKDDKMLKGSFVRNLPVPIQDKRNYRQSIVLHLKRKPWYTKLWASVSQKFENFLSRIDLWRKSLKIIEGKHGAAIVAYFFFIRWLLYMNIIIFILNFIFLVLPQILFYEGQAVEDSHANASLTISSTKTENLDRAYDVSSYSEKYKYFKMPSSSYLEDSDITKKTPVDTLVLHCQTLYSQQTINETRTSFSAVVQSILQGSGLLEPTHLFLGFYPPSVDTKIGFLYSMNLVSLCLLYAIFIICFSMMIQYTTVGIQEAFLAQSNFSSYYSNELFSAWDYGIDKPRSAERKHYAFVLNMKTSLSEDRTSKEKTERSTKTWMKLYAIRFIINIFIVLWLFWCYFLIYQAVVFQMHELQKHRLTEAGFGTFFVQFLSPVTIVILNSVSPVIFSMLVPFEKYHAQTELNISLFRNLFLYLSSNIVLLNTFYQQIACDPKDFCGAGLDQNCRSPRCWETFVGQQFFKLSITDTFVYLGVFLGHDVPRNFIVKKFHNKFTKLVERREFSLSTEVLNPVNSQTVIWLGVFYSPLLPAVMVIKLIIIFYIKKKKVLSYCEPSEKSFRASKFNAVFVMILLISFFVVLIVQTFAIDNIHPSRGCSPYRYFTYMTEAVPSDIRKISSLFVSSWTIILAAVLLCIIIHYYVRIINSQKELATRLQTQLIMASQDKQFLLKRIAALTKEKSSKL